MNSPMQRPNVIRCSSLARFMSCLGAQRLSNEPDTESEEAKAGTAWHWAIEMSRKTGVRTLAGAIAPNGVRIDNEMIFYMNKVLENLPPTAAHEVQVRYQPNPDVPVWIEGTLDAAWEEDNGETLVINDFKYGYGLVEVGENWQLMGYAFGALINWSKTYKRVKMKIMQPRPHHEDGWIRDYVLDVHVLHTYYYKELSDRANEYWNTTNQFATGKHCKFCKGVERKCPALNKSFFNSVDVVLNTEQLDDLTNREVSDMLMLWARIKDVMKIKSEAITDLATARISQGQIIDGFSIKRSLGHRKWTPDVTPEAIMMMTGIDITKKEMISPNQAEVAGVDKNFIKSFTHQPELGFKLEMIEAGKLADKVFKNVN